MWRGAAAFAELGALTNLTRLHLGAGFPISDTALADTLGRLRLLEVTAARLPAHRCDAPPGCAHEELISSQPGLNTIAAAASTGRIQQCLLPWASYACSPVVVTCTAQSCRSTGWHTT